MDPLCFIAPLFRWFYCIYFGSADRCCSKYCPARLFERCTMSGIIESVLGIYGSTQTIFTFPDTFAVFDGSQTKRKAFHSVYRCEQYVSNSLENVGQEYLSLHAYSSTRQTYSRNGAEVKFWGGSNFHFARNICMTAVLDTEIRELESDTPASTNNLSPPWPLIRVKA